MRSPSDSRSQAESLAKPTNITTQLKLMIRADRNADTITLNAIIARLQRSGVGAARLATEVPR